MGQGKGRGPDDAVGEHDRLLGPGQQQAAGQGHVHAREQARGDDRDVLGLDARAQRGFVEGVVHLRGQVDLGDVEVHLDGGVLVRGLLGVGVHAQVEVVGVALVVADQSVVALADDRAQVHAQGLLGGDGGADVLGLARGVAEVHLGVAHPSLAVQEHLHLADAGDQVREGGGEGLG